MPNLTAFVDNLYTAPAAIIFFLNESLYSPIVPSQRLMVLFSHTRISLATLSSNL